MSSMQPFLRSVCFLAMVVLALLLGGCSLPGGECSADELGRVENLSPSDIVVDSLTPGLTWDYPDTGCTPNHYDIAITHVETRYQAEADSRSYNVPVSAGLQPGHTYWWSVLPNTADDQPGGGQVVTVFTTGPACAPGTDVLPPMLVNPPDGAELRSDRNPLGIVWENQMNCWPGGGIHLQISKRPDFSPPLEIDSAIIHESTWFPFEEPPFTDCTRYFWRVGLGPAGGGEPVYSETRSFTLRLTDVVCPVRLITPIPPDLHIPLAGVKTAANCRSGPGLDYPVLDILQEGASLPVNGRNQANTWWQVNDPAIEKDCWLAGNLVEISGDGAQAPVVQAAPPPAAASDTPVPAADCAQYNSNTCPLHPACQWDQKSTTCKNK